MKPAIVEVVVDHPEVGVGWAVVATDPETKRRLAKTFLWHSDAEDEAIRLAGKTIGEIQSEGPPWFGLQTPEAPAKPRMIDRLKEMFEGQNSDAVSNDRWPKLEPVIDGDTVTGGWTLRLHNERLLICFDETGERLLGVVNWKE